MAITFVKKAVAAVLGQSPASQPPAPEKTPESAPVALVEPSQPDLSVDDGHSDLEVTDPESQLPQNQPAHVETAPSKPLGTVQGQTLMDAIKEFANRGPKDKRTLMVIKKDNSISYKVVSHDLHTGRTAMVSTEGIEIRPIIRPQEESLYYPMWR